MSVNSAGGRLTDVILSNRMTKKDFAAALGYNPSYITQICLNIKQPSKELAAKVERCFGVPADWILHGKRPEAELGLESLPVSPLRDAVMAKIERMESEAALSAVMSFIRCYEELSKERFAHISDVPVKMSTRPKLFTIPVKGEVAGGLPLTVYEERHETVQAPVLADSALYLKGRSMEPEYPDGSLLLVKENAYVVNGDTVVALIMKEAEVAEATCKVYRKRGDSVTLSPLNPEYENQVYSLKECEIKIFGKVIGVI